MANVLIWWACGLATCALIWANWSYEVDAVNGRIWKAPSFIAICGYFLLSLFGPALLIATGAAFVAIIAVTLYRGESLIEQLKD